MDYERNEIEPRSIWRHYFLNAQKSQYNKLCWLYIGPVAKVSENQIRCIAECIVITEDLSMYEWILQTFEVMEPIWSVNNFLPTV